jgi:hypothetical protein
MQAVESASKGLQEGEEEPRGSGLGGPPPQVSFHLPHTQAEDRQEQALKGDSKQAEPVPMCMVMRPLHCPGR